MDSRAHLDRVAGMVPGALALALVVLLTPSPLLADGVAVLAGVQGEVEVSPARGGRARPVSFGHALLEGDRLLVGDGALATVLFHDGNLLEVAGRSTLRIRGRAAGRAAPGLPAEVYASVTKFVSAGSSASGRAALPALRGDGTPTWFLMAPRRTAILTGRPEFRWRAVPGATRYRLTLSPAERGDLWSREVEGLALPFPEDAPPLAAPGDYLWEVVALSDAKVLGRESSEFEVLGAAQAETVTSHLGRIREVSGGGESPVALFLSASYLSQSGLFQEAIDRFADLCRLSPSSPAAHEALGAVYERVGLWDLAAAAFQTALALTREP